MTDDPRNIPTRRGRLHAYLAHNRDRMLVDGIVVGTWVIVCWTGSGAVGLPAWLSYLVLFIGVIVYSRLTPPWARPYRSPDLPASSEELEQGQDDGDQPE